ncbi:MAG: dipeptidase [Salinivirgaceae bacterium]
MKTIKILPILLLFVLITGCKSQTLDEKTKRIHAKALTVDSHTDTPLRFTRDNFSIADYHNGRETHSSLDLPRMEQGGLDAVFIAAFISQKKRDDEGLEQANKQTHTIIDSIYAQVNANSNKVAVATTAQDAYTNEANNKKSFYIGIENGYALGGDINQVDAFYNRGVRYITLCHTKNNSLCDSSNDTTEHNGLSDYGSEVVKRMNSLGMMIDVSHISDKSFADVLEISSAPVIASHSNARAVCDHVRNMTDEMLVKLAENGGVIQVCLLSDYVRPPVKQPKRDSAFDALRQKYNNYKGLSDEVYAQAVKEWYETRREYPQILATVADLVDHIDHIVDVAGIDHVGIGSDFDGGGALEDCFDVSEMQNITKELIVRGYSEEEIIKIWGGNFMRVFREVEARKK